MASRFQLSSTQTAVALIVPVHLSKEVDLVRSIHDKAYGRWPAHINLLYPSVPLTDIYDAIDALRKHLVEERRGKVRTTVGSIDMFRQRRSATIFLKPSDESTRTLCQLRNSLCSALGVKESEGTHDGEFKPHLTIGQAGLNDHAIDSVTQKAQNLVGLEWESTSLVVLKRNSSGEMVPIADLPFGDPSEGNARGGQIVSVKSAIETSAGWKECFHHQAGGWMLSTESPDIPIDASRILVSSFNLMTEDFAPDFKDRLPIINDEIQRIVTSKQHDHRVLCLQEANSELLSMLLKSPVIQQYYAYSSHPEHSKFQSHRNLVTFASVPFRSFNLLFQERHKSALLIQFHSSNLTVANVHLTSALTDENVEIKSQQMKKLVSFLSRSGLLHQSILAGDFNITTSTRTIQTAIERRIITPETGKAVQTLIDLNEWEDAFVLSGSADNENQEMDYYPGEEGATFSRLRNPLAALSEAVIDDRPQRYDRIIYRAKGGIEAEEFGMFLSIHEAGHVVSDHYGIYGILRVTDSPELRELTHPVEDLHKMQLETIKEVNDDTDILPLIAPYLPSTDNRKRREMAMANLEEILTADATKKDIIFAPLGSFSMDTFFSDSDMDILVIGSAAPRNFFENAVTRLREWRDSQSGSESEKFKVHLINSLVQIIEVEIYNVKFDLQYCQAPELVKSYLDNDSPRLETLVFDSAAISDLHPNSMRALNTYRETVYIRKTVPALESFRTAYRLLSLYLRRRGLYSAKFGYLGGVHLLLMLNRVAKLIASQHSRNDVDTTSQKDELEISPASFVRTFFNYYAEIDWRQNIVEDPNPAHQTLPIKRSVREPVVIRAIFSPTARPNVAASCSSMSVRTFAAEFGLAKQKLEEGQWKWCLRPEKENVSDFLNDAEAFIKIKVELWNLEEQSSDQVRDVVGSLESRIPLILVSLARSGDIMGRVWPARFRTSDDDSDRTAVSGYYLIAINMMHSEDDPDVDKKTVIGGKVLSATREFEGIVQHNKTSGNQNIWVSVEVASKKKIWDMGMFLDERDWSRLASGTVSSTIASAEEETVKVSGQALSKPIHSKSSKATGSGSKKLRPIQDVISRLRWDSSYSEDDYVIGYEDRFVGIKEIDLKDWKQEQTDLEFIPSHRIVWVRTKGDGGEKIWDRRTRFDALFGSGNTRSGT